MFHPLGEAQIADIAKIQLKALEARLAKLEIRLDGVRRGAEGRRGGRLRSGLRRAAAEARDPAADRESAGEGDARRQVRRRATRSRSAPPAARSRSRRADRTCAQRRRGAAWRQVSVGASSRRGRSGANTDASQAATRARRVLGRPAAMADFVDVVRQHAHRGAALRLDQREAAAIDRVRRRRPPARCRACRFSSVIHSVPRVTRSVVPRAPSSRTSSPDAQIPDLRVAGADHGQPPYSCVECIRIGHGALAPASSCRRACLPPSQQRMLASAPRSAQTVFRE